MHATIELPDPLQPFRKELVSRIADAAEIVIELCAPNPESAERLLVRQAVTNATAAVLTVLDGDEELLNPNYIQGYCVLPIAVVKCTGERPNLAGGLAEAYLDLFEDINN